MTQSWCQLGGISFPLLLCTAPSGWVKWYWNCFLLHLLLMYCFLLLFCFQQFICSLYFWFLSWIYVIIKLIRVAVPCFLRNWCRVVSVEGFSKMLCLICFFDRVRFEAFWLYLFVSIFPSWHLTGPFLFYNFHLEFHSSHNTVLSYHSGVRLNLCFHCNSIYPFFHLLLEFAACLHLSSVLSDTCLVSAWGFVLSPHSLPSKVSWLI